MGMSAHTNLVRANLNLLLPGALILMCPTHLVPARRKSCKVYTLPKRGSACGHGRGQDEEELKRGSGAICLDIDETSVMEERLESSTSHRRGVKAC